MNLTKMLFDLRTTLPSPWGDRMWIVEPGEFYRSRLLDPREIEQVRDEYGTNSVISLLGKYPNPDWLDREIETCERLGMGFHNLKVETPRDFNDMGKIENLIGIYNECDIPILVHCLYGSDRCGVASFVYQRFFKDRPFGEAERQLSLKYGHFGKFPLVHNEYRELLGGIEKEYGNLKALVRDKWKGDLGLNVL